MEVRQGRVDGFGVGMYFMHIFPVDFILFGAELYVDIEFAHALGIFPTLNLFIKWSL